MTNEELCILAQSGNADAENELIDHLLQIGRVQPLIFQEQA